MAGVMRSSGPAVEVLVGEEGLCGATAEELEPTLRVLGSTNGAQPHTRTHADIPGFSSEVTDARISKHAQSCIQIVGKCQSCMASQTRAEQAARRVDYYLERAVSNLPPTVLVEVGALRGHEQPH